MDGAGGPPAPAAPGFRARVVLSLFVTLLVLGMVVASWVVDRQLQGPIRAWAQTVAENLASRAVAVAVRDRVAPSLAGTPLSQPLYDGSGRLQGITYATGAITRIASEAALHIHDQLEAAAAAQLPVPLGQILGLDFLAAAGPRVGVRVVPAGSVEVTPRATFQAAGINQTLHRILLEVTVHVQVVIPGYAPRVTVVSQVPLVEQLVVGQVPFVYMDWSGDPRTLPPGGLRWDHPPDR
mgnify:FL=1